jgi:hypothetical protein
LPGRPLGEFGGARASQRRRHLDGASRIERAMNAREWIDAFAERLGTASPSAREWSALLELSGLAARSSERVAAPVSCWVAARAGISPEEALAAARALAGEHPAGEADA